MVTPVSLTSEQNERLSMKDFKICSKEQRAEDKRYIVQKSVKGHNSFQ